MPRILTYNVHRCVGVDRRLDVDRVAAVIARLEPDIVALQELDVGRIRTQGVDQAHEIARQLDMTFHFHPALRVEEELYGDALLTRYPERKVKAGALPGHPRIPQLEPRGALWSEVEIGGARLQVVNTHLGLVPREQHLQAAALAGPEWLQHPARRGPTILLGDFNATTSAIAYKLLSARLRPARGLASSGGNVATFPSTFPVLRIDHLFVSDEIRVGRLFTPDDALARVASDHRPLVMDFEISA